jgi:Tfp pilus assembly protein PilF
MLGVGGIVSGQLDKAEDRLTKVVNKEPDNLEALLLMAEVKERKGDKAGAVHWYESARKYVKDEGLLQDLDNKLKSLK